MRELFVYYRVRSGAESRAREIVLALQAQLRLEHPQLHARLLRRSESPPHDSTWMETYATDPSPDAVGITVELQHLIESRAATLAPCLSGPRHVEVFVSCIDLA